MQQHSVITAPLSGIILLIWAIWLVARHKNSLLFLLAPWSIAATWITSSLLSTYTMKEAFKQLEVVPIAEKSHFLTKAFSKVMEIQWNTTIIMVLIFLYLLTISLLKRDTPIDE